MTARARIYLAGPLGFSEAGRHFHSRVLVPFVRGLGYQVLDPWRLVDAREVAAVERMPRGERRYRRWRRLSRRMAATNRDAIDRADGMVAVLDGTDVDSGTAAEIGYAFGRGKVIVGYRGDFRLSADNEGSDVNLQVEFFIRQSGGTIVKRHRELRAALRGCLAGRARGGGGRA